MVPWTVNGEVRLLFKSLLIVESTNSGMDSGSDEADSKPKKKPGRKMMMTEPLNVSTYLVLSDGVETKSTE